MSKNICNYKEGKGRRKTGKPEHPPPKKKSHSSIFRRTQIRWVFWPSSNVCKLIVNLRLNMAIQADLCVRQDLGREGNCPNWSMLNSVGLHQHAGARQELRIVRRFFLNPTILAPLLQKLRSPVQLFGGGGGGEGNNFLFSWLRLGNPLTMYRCLSSLDGPRESCKWSSPPESGTDRGEVICRDGVWQVVLYLFELSPWPTRGWIGSESHSRSLAWDQCRRGRSEIP